jgi:hypothetical protein
MKAHRGVDVWIYILLTSSLVGGELSASRPGRFTPGERAPGTHWIGNWVDIRAGLDDLKKRKFLTLPGLELRPLGRLARSQSLYRLRYLDSSCFGGLHEKDIFGKIKTDDHLFGGIEPKTPVHAEDSCWSLRGNVAAFHCLRCLYLTKTCIYYSKWRL